MWYFLTLGDRSLVNRPKYNMSITITKHYGLWVSFLRDVADIISMFLNATVSHI